MQIVETSLKLRDIVLIILFVLVEKIGHSTRINRTMADVLVKIAGDVFKLDVNKKDIKGKFSEKKLYDLSRFMKLCIYLHPS